MTSEFSTIPLLVRTSPPPDEGLGFLALYAAFGLSIGFTLSSALWIAAPTEVRRHWAATLGLRAPTERLLVLKPVVPAGAVIHWEAPTHAYRPADRLPRPQRVEAADLRDAPAAVPKCPPIYAPAPEHRRDDTGLGTGPPGEPDNLW